MRYTKPIHAYVIQPCTLRTGQHPLRDIAELKAQIAEKSRTSDQTAPDDKDAVVLAVGGGGASELCHQQQFVADGAQFVVVIAGQLKACRVKQLVGFLIHGRFPSR
jgi:hypothetical protein